VPDNFHWVSWGEGGGGIQTCKRNLQKLRFERLGVWHGRQKIDLNDGLNSNVRVV
jgi:hypothetical protein